MRAGLFAQDLLDALPGDDGSAPYGDQAGAGQNEHGNSQQHDRAADDRLHRASYGVGLAGGGPVCAYDRCRSGRGCGLLRRLLSERRCHEAIVAGRRLTCVVACAGNGADVDDGCVLAHTSSLAVGGLNPRCGFLDYTGRVFARHPILLLFAALSSFGNEFFATSSKVCGHYLLATGACMRYTDGSGFRASSARVK